MMGTVTPNSKQQWPLASHLCSSCLSSWNAWRSQQCSWLLGSLSTPPSLCSSSLWEWGGLGVEGLPLLFSGNLLPSDNPSGHVAGTSPNSLWRLRRGLSICGPWQFGGGVLGIHYCLLELQTRSPVPVPNPGRLGLGRVAVGW